MEFPDDVLRLISAFSKPVTRTDWRTLRIMPNITFRGEYYLIYLKRRNKLYVSTIEEYTHLNVYYKPQFSSSNYERLFADKLYYF